MTWFRLLIPALVLGLACGCGPSGPRKVRVSGTVTMDGKPLDQGEIYFKTEGSGTAPEILSVANGKFEGDVTVGRKRVEVHSAREIKNQGGMSMGQPLILNRVSDEFNVNSKLTADVTDDGLKPSTFEVKSNPEAR